MHGCQGILVPQPTTVLRLHWQPSSCASFGNLCSSKGCVFPIYWRSQSVCFFSPKDPKYLGKQKLFTKDCKTGNLSFPFSLQIKSLSLARDSLGFALNQPVWIISYQCGTMPRPAQAQRHTEMVIPSQWSWELFGFVLCGVEALSWLGGARVPQHVLLFINTPFFSRFYSITATQIPANTAFNIKFSQANCI